MNDKKHGYGINRWADGEIFYGEYKNNKRNGKGYYRWANGNEYWGEWKNGIICGEGVKQQKGLFYNVVNEGHEMITRSEEFVV